jgi:hypothetical protein
METNTEDVDYYLLYLKMHKQKPEDLKPLQTALLKKILIRDRTRPELMRLLNEPNSTVFDALKGLIKLKLIKKIDAPPIERSLRHANREHGRPPVQYLKILMD